MRLKELFSDDDAVSPVIGVILMVAITVILAAVIGAFVLNFGDSQSSTPTVSVTAEENSSGAVIFTIDSANEQLESDTVYARGSLDSTHGSVSSGEITYSSGPYGAGDSLIVQSGAVSSGGTITLVWDDGDTSSTLTEIEV